MDNDGGVHFDYLGVVVGAFFLMFVLMLVFAGILSAFSPLNTPLGTLLGVLGAMMAETTLLGSLWFVRRYRGIWHRLLGLRRPRAGELLGAAALGAVLSVLSQLIPAALGEVGVHLGGSDTTNEVFALSGASQLAVTFFLVPIVAPLLEEHVFRGFMLGSILRSGLRGRRTVALAVMVPSLLFALAHAQGFSTATDLWVLCWTGFFGVLLAVLRLRRNCLWLCVATHACYNLSTVLLGLTMMKR